MGLKGRAPDCVRYRVAITRNRTQVRVQVYSAVGVVWGRAMDPVVFGVAEAGCSRRKPMQMRVPVAPGCDEGCAGAGCGGDESDKEGVERHEAEGEEEVDAGDAAEEVAGDEAVIQLLPKLRSE